MINGKSTPARKAMYLKYNKSTIFTPDSKSTTNPNRKKEPKVTSKITSKNKPKKEFVPQYENITAQERYLRQLGLKDKPKYKPLKTEVILSKTERAKPKEKKENLKAEDIMCRDMFNGCDAKQYKLRRCKSTYISRSTFNGKENKEVDARTRLIDNNKSNIFFLESKANQNNIDYANSVAKTEASESTKSTSTVPKKTTIKRSSAPSNADWKTFNTEAIFHKKSRTLDAKEFENMKKNFKKTNFFDKENNNSELDKQKANIDKKGDYNNIESVQYDIISGEKNNEKPYTHMKTTSSLYPLNSNNQITDTYEIIVSKNMSVTDKNTIKNYFVNKGMHLYKVEEIFDPLNSDFGKICFNIRRNKNDPEYLKKIEGIKTILNNKQMKLNYIEPQAKKLKPRPKTPGQELKNKTVSQINSKQSYAKKVHPKVQYQTNYKNREMELTKQYKK